MTLAEDYKNFVDYIPTIVQNWRPINGQTEEVSQARLAHFKNYFEVDSSTDNAPDKIIEKWHQANTDSFSIIQAELGLSEHQGHFCDYLAYLCFLHTNFTIQNYLGENKKFNLIQSHWERLINEIGQQHTKYQKHKLKLEIEIWYELITELRNRGAEPELLELLPKELESLINDVERGLEYFDAPFYRTQEEHEKVRLRLNRSTQEYFKALQRHGLKTITDFL